MKTYLGVRTCQAEPTTLLEFSKKYGAGGIQDREDGSAQGYAVKNSLGEYCFAPKAAFEDEYLEMGYDPTIISPSMVKAMRGDLSATKIDANTAMVSATGLTGFRVYEVSSCVDPENFSMEVGMARCEPKIDDVFWKCLGFTLQWAVNGLKGNRGE